MGKKIFDLFIYSNIFIAICAVVMAMQTSEVLLQEPPNRDLLFFIFFASICSYSFHWWLTTDSVVPSPRIDWTRKFRYVHLALFFIGLAVAAFFFYRLIDYWPVLLLSAAMTFLYSAPKIPHPFFRALRQLALGKTIFLALVWMIVTTLLPAWISARPWTGETTLFCTSRFFQIYAICIIFDYRDREDDKKQGVKSLITYLSDTGIYHLFYFSLLVFLLSTCLLLFYGYPFLTIAILLLPGIVTAFLFDYAKRHFSDWFYYFLLDGLMALSAFIMLIPGL